jgi:hypothetical protein
MHCGLHFGTTRGVRSPAPSTSPPIPVYKRLGVLSRPDVAGKQTARPRTQIIERKWRNNLKSKNKNKIKFCWNYNSIQFNSILYFNVLTQQQREPITESAQENNKCTKICLCIICYLQNNNINTDNRTNYCSYANWICCCN